MLFITSAQLSNIAAQSFWSSRGRLAAISSCVLHLMCEEMQMEEKEEERKGKDFDAIIAREYAKDYTEMVTYLAYLLVRQTKISAGICFSTALHCSFRLHSVHDQCSSQIGSTLSSHTWKVMTLKSYLWRRSGTGPYLWPLCTSLPSGTDSQSIHASSSRTVTLRVNMYKLHNWPSCCASYHSDRGHWFHCNWRKIWAGATDLKQWAVLFCCLTLIKDAGAPYASTSLTRPIVEGERIRWWNGHQGSCSIS